jgi:hypothetical protein
MAETWPDAPDAPESAAAVYRRYWWDRVSGARTLAVGALAVILWSCGGMDVTPTRQGTASVAPITPEPVSTSAPTVTPTQHLTPPPAATEMPLEFLPGVNADGYKDALVDTLNATCRDGDGADGRLWTCSYRDEVAISFYGPSPAEVSAFRVVTDAGREVDRRSWLRGYASIISVEVFEWVYDHVGSNETAKVDGVWVQMTHDATSDGVLISAKDPGP